MSDKFAKWHPFSSQGALINRQTFALSTPKFVLQVRSSSSPFLQKTLDVIAHRYFDQLSEMANMQNFFGRLKRMIPGSEYSDSEFPPMPLYEKFLKEENEWIQITNENFFENFTVLSWRRENQKLQVLRNEESNKDGLPPAEPPVPPEQIYRIDKKLWENLYVEVLYTIKHKLGINSNNYIAYTDDLYEYARETFNMSPEEHKHFMNVAGEEKPPITVLNVNVMEACDLEAKDPNGTSDPYCMLGILGAESDDRNGDKKKLCGQPDAEEGTSTSTAGSALRGLKKFGASFKKRQVKHPKEPDVVPARLIMTTTVKKATLCPKWREKFRLDIEDPKTDRLHLDIWDHDDETSVIDAAKRLNEVSNLKGLGRYFKEIAQSARSSNGENSDDFLGSINIPLEGLKPFQSVGSKGLDQWFPLEARSHRSSVTGEVRLRLQLGTREDRGLPTGNDNEREVLEHQQLIWVMVTHELQESQGHPYQWAGDLPQQALTILHQHAMQGDITELQEAVCQWISYYRKHKEVVLDYSLMYQHLEEVEVAWAKEEEVLSMEAEETLSETFTDFIAHCMDLIRNHRTQFPSHNTVARHKLKFMLKCLKFLYSMGSFKELFPFRNEVRIEVTHALKKGTIDWLEEIRGVPVKSDAIRDFIKFVDILNRDLQKGRSFYHLMFEIVDVSFCAAIYRQMSRWAFENVGNTPYNLSHKTQELMSKFLVKLPPTDILELFLVLQEFRSFNTCLPEEEQAGMALTYSYMWFESCIKEWFSVAVSKIRGRIYFALEHDRDLHNQPQGIAIDLQDEGLKIQISETPPDKIKYSSSAVEAVQSFRQLKEFWYQLLWPDNYTAYTFILSIIEATTAGIVLYSNLLWKRLKDDPKSFNAKGHFFITKKVILFINNLEYVLGGLHNLEEDLKVKSVIQAVKLKEHQAAAELLSAKISYPINETQTHVLMMIDCFVKSVTYHMNCKIKKLMFHLAWGPENMEPEQSIAPLLSYLERIFQQIRMSILHITFQKVVHAAWQKVLEEYAITSAKNVKEKTRFFRNLYISLSILTEFFHGDVAMLPLEELQCQIYKTVEREIRIQQSETLHLIEYYYFSRLDEQLNSREAPLGYLTVKAYYDEKKGTLFIEVMNARGLLPCDPNGLSDPFVIIQLVPRHLFPIAEVQKTSTHMKTLNPIFMETFEWNVSLEHFRNRATSINFVVMDFDYMRKNDFEGEGYLPLHKIANAAQEMKDKETLEPTELILTCPNLKSDILVTLGKRTWDKEAMRLLVAEKKKS